MVKKYVIEGVVALLLMILVLVGHMIEVKLEKEEKEYIDLKLQKQKTSFYNTIRDILMNIFMFLVFMCGKIYFNTDAILVFFPSFLLLFYYSNRREKRRFNIFLFLVFAVSGILTNNLITFVNVNVSIMLEIVLFLFFLVIYSRVKIVGIFGIAILAAFQGGDNNTKLVLFVMFLLLAFVYENVRKISYIAIYIFSFCILKIQNPIVLLLLLVLFAFLYIKTTKKVVKKNKKNGIELGEKEEVFEYSSEDALVHFEKKEEEKPKDFVNFDINEIEPKEDFVEFNIEDLDNK